MREEPRITQSGKPQPKELNHGFRGFNGWKKHFNAKTRRRGATNRNRIRSCPQITQINADMKTGNSSSASICVHLRA
jgi:hypothetical protein